MFTVFSLLARGVGRGALPPVLLIVSLTVALLGNPVLGRAAEIGETKPTSGLVVPQSLRYQPDQVYCQKENLQLKLDVVAPKAGKGPYPAVVILHGGGWVRGNHKVHTPLAVRLAERGYVAVLVSHRFAPTYPFPAQVHDVKEAVRWLRTNAVKCDLDPERIGALGYSTGGHLACMLGLTRKSDGLEGEGTRRKPGSEVQCVVSLSGLTDLTELHACCGNGRLKVMSAALVKFALEKFLPGPPEQANGSYVKASPIAYVQKGRAVPPVLLIHGTGDELIPFEQSERLYRKLKHVDADVALVALYDAGHEMQAADAQLAEAAALAFLDRHLQH